MSDAGFGRLDLATVFTGLRMARINYTVDEVNSEGWHSDEYRSALPPERPGPPEPDGTWETACRLVEAYEFSAPELVRAVYDPDDMLLGRDMLLEARFYGLHFYCGVRVTSVTDETRSDGSTTWGWSYETLDGHLERGRMTYEVVKDGSTGEVEFVASSYSQRAPTIGPVVRLGWRLFGRRTQRRFHRGCGQRIRHLVEQHAGNGWTRPPSDRADALVLAPSTATRSPLDLIAFHRVLPG